MWMEFADDVADHARAFLESGLGIEAELAHGVKQSAVDGFQAIARIGKGTRGDGGKRIGEIALAQCFAERLWPDVVLDRCFAHADLSEDFGLTDVYADSALARAASSFNRCLASGNFLSCGAKTHWLRKWAVNSNPARRSAGCASPACRPKRKGGRGSKRSR